jgi:hypothetical protein
MSKKIVLMSGDAESREPDISVNSSTDWTKCIICQVDKEDQLASCPANSFRTGTSGYETFATNALEFETLGEIPLDVDLERLNDGEGIQQTLEKHKAWWHKSCYNRFGSYHLTRVRKRKSDEDTELEECSPVKTRTSIGAFPQIVVVCFLCGEQGGKDGLHIALTKDITVNVRKAATALRDRPLLAKIGTTDLVAQDAQYHKACLTSLYNRERQALASAIPNTVD